MSFVLGGSALARLVVATDTPKSHLDDLTETYQARSEHEIMPGIRWFYCAGFGTALACMGVISVSHVHKEIEGLRLRKCYRLTGRFCVAIVLICLPLATSFDSLELLAIVTCLIVLCLGSELWASSCCHEKLCERSQPCKYFGRCGKKDMQRLILDGKEIDVDGLVSSEKGRDEGMMVAL
jgi:hypothetical protein